MGCVGVGGVPREIKDNNKFVIKTNLILYKIKMNAVNLLLELIQSLHL